MSDNSTQKIRYGWLDVFKALSIFFIIFAHLGGAGNLQPFVFSFMVHCFFFASGLTCASGLNKPFKEFLVIKAKRLILPYLSFGLLNIATIFLTDNPADVKSVVFYLRQLLYGNRVRSFAATLWFFPCLFFMSIFYYLVAKAVKGRWTRLLVCVAISFTFRLFSEGNVLPWGVDNAVRFLIYYAAGDAFSASLSKLANDTSLFFKKPWVALLSILSITLAYFQYQFGLTYFIDRLGIPQSYMVLALLGCFYAFNGIFLTAMASIALRNVKSLQTVGRETLLICGLQKPVDRLVACTFSLFGLTMSTATQANCIVLAAIFLFVSVKLAKPIHEYFPHLIGEKSGEK
ncbi:MAG: acyltransferase [Oscillospiraceae bacterium]